MTDGIYKYVRHVAHILAVMYYMLVRREEMEMKFEAKYTEYKQRVLMFIPLIKI